MSDGGPRSPRFGSTFVLQRSISLLFLLAIASVAPAQVFTVMHAFSAQRGNSEAGLVAGSNGKLYGTTAYGGRYGRGTIFSLTPDGSGGFEYAEVFEATPESGIGGIMGPLLEAPDGNFYGTSRQDPMGTVFRMSPAGEVTRLHTFTQAEGVYPQALIDGGNGYFYGVALSGGAWGNGDVFQVDPDGNPAILASFNGTNGAAPVGSLLLASDGYFYGVTALGGPGDLGTVFRIRPGEGITTVHAFAPDEGSSPAAALMQASDGALWGTTLLGGAENGGTVFRIDAGGTFSTVHEFGAIGSPRATLVERPDGWLYGASGGAVFRIDPAGTFETLHVFAPGDGNIVYGALLDVGDAFVGTTNMGGSGGYGTVFRVDPAGAFAVLHDFGAAPDGSQPSAGLLAASDGYLYGSAYWGGAHNLGTIFRSDLAGNVSVVHAIAEGEGANPTGKLLESPEGVFYGTTSTGSTLAGGTAFRVDAAGSFALLHTFDYSEGVVPQGGLIRGSDGNLYGTLWGGGLYGWGTLFRMTDTGVVSVLHDFDGTNGGRPFGGLVEGGDGGFYGTTSEGGDSNRGTVFRLDPSRQLSTIRSFGGSLGEAPLAGLTPAADGSLYGTTSDGGDGCAGSGCGVVFRIGPPSDFAKVHNFDAPQGTGSSADLLQASDGLLYGVNRAGGDGFGTVFRVSPNGEFALLHTFTGDDGFFPSGGLAEGADGNLYGTTYGGGPMSGGVLFRIDPAAAIHVSSLTPASGPASGGTAVDIAGSGFASPALVRIGGQTVPSTVTSGTLIAVTSPALPPGSAYDVQVSTAAQTQIIRRAWFVDPSDVPAGDPFSDDVQRIFRDGISAGCGAGLYCRDAAVTRAQMAILLLKAKLGASYVPPPARGLAFFDVPADAFAAAWIEDLAFRGFTAGCGFGNYCPNAPVTRSAAATLVLRATLGAHYQPPDATGTMFLDVPSNSFAAAWIEDLVTRGISAGCAAAPALFCPGAPTTRAQMAALLVRAFGLP